MNPVRRTLLAVVACIATIAFVAVDAHDLRDPPGVAQAYADDDGGRGDGRSRGRRSFDRRDDGGPTLLRPWRKRKARVRRAARRPVVQAQYEPGMLIARGLSDGTLAGLERRGYVVVERHALGPGDLLLKLRVSPGQSLETARREIRAAEPNALVDLNHYYRPESLECSGRRCLMRQISGWPIGEAPAACHPSAPIGLIDTRINVKHPSLAESRITLLALFEGDVEPSGAHHGTAVAALLVGKGTVPGLVPEAELIAIDAFRKGDVATGFDLARAIEMLVARGVPVINMSLSGPDNSILAATVAKAAERNVLIVAAAGNDGPRSKPVFPAAYPGVIAVTAVDGGRNVYRRAARGAHVDIAAPGVNVWTAASVKGQRPRSGTSFAAPFVSAAAALILSENPGFGRQEVEIVLQNEASDLGERGRDDVFGWGLLDVRRVCAG